MESLRATFREEAIELINLLEEALLVLEKNLDDKEALATAFRAVHTIKGSGGIFDFDGLVRFAHEVEDLLDALRNSRLPMTHEIAALLIASCDHLSLLVEHYTTDSSEGNLKHLLAANNAILIRIRQVILQEKNGRVSTVENILPPRFRIELKEDIFFHGLFPEKALRFLLKYAQVDKIQIVAQNLPVADTFNPESGSLAFDVVFAESVSEVQAEDFLKEAFEFLLSHINIQKVAGTFEESNPQKTVENKSAPKREGATEANIHKEKETEQGKASKQLRVSSDKLDLLVDLVGELVMKNSTLQQLSRAHQSKEFSRPVSEMTRLVENVRELAMNLRMVPIGRTFNRMERVVRDAASVSGKDVRLLLKGEDTELDKSVIERIGDPLMHIVRNAVDHGIEKGDERIKNGKKKQGTISLSAYNSAGAIVIEVADDGRGLDLEKILEKARAKGIAEVERDYSDTEIQQFIFSPGFSTAQTVTEISGRGVGMDVVKKNIDALRGTIRIHSISGSGMTLRIVLPLTLAIIDGFVVRAGEQKFVFPLESVKECIDFGEKYAHTEHENKFFNLRNEALPYAHLAKIFSLDEVENPRASLVVLEDGEHRFGVVVDEPLGEHKTVIKPLTGLLNNLRGIGGVTILGTRDMAFIVDIQGLLELISLKQKGVLNEK
ncbi:MAG: Chemotaxis protein CheA [Turneriella sp.]|nr:Chemotaxis protein CheA [Turneriella sp.]